MKKVGLRNEKLLIRLITPFVFIIFLSAIGFPGQIVSFKEPPPPSLQPRNAKVAEGVDQAVKFAKALSKEERDAYISLKKSPTKTENFPCKIDKDGNIQVYIYLTDLNSDNIKNLEQKGVKVQLSSNKRKLVQAYVPMDRLDEISKMKEINLIAVPSYAVTFTGSVTTAADQDENLGTAKARRDFNIDTSKVKVGAISDGILYIYYSLMTQDIDTTPTYYSPYGNPFDGNEGTALLEIVADLAPKARLYFSNCWTDLEMNMAKEWLAYQGCHIIVDDLGFFMAGPLDGMSELSLKNGELVSRGICYYTSVGNMAQYHYMGQFTDWAVPNGVHEFHYDEVLQQADETLEMVHDYPTYGRILLQWDQDDPAGPWVSSDDIDLYLLDSDTLDWSHPIYASTTIQNGTTPPYEWIVSEYLVRYSVVIRRKNAQNKYPRRFHLFMYPMSNIEYKVASGSIMNNNEAGGGCISVGAIDVGQTYGSQYKPTKKFVEDFSSQGPTDDGRLKPEIASYDGVFTSTYGFEYFFGTSAAAPHVAGVAALMKAMKPSLTPNEISSMMRMFATDIHTPGDDYFSGSGRLEGYSMLKYINDSINNIRSRIYSFQKDSEGWQQQTLPDLAPPQFIYEGGSIELVSRNNSNCYGSWVSPVIEFANSSSPNTSYFLIGSKIYEARFRVRTNAYANDFPTFRLRLGAKNNVFAVVKVVYSVPGNEEYPTPNGRDYYIYFDPPASAYSQGMYAAFDIMNFDSSDDPNAILYLDEVVITELAKP